MMKIIRMMMMMMIMMMMMMKTLDHKQIMNTKSIIFVLSNEPKFELSSSIEKL